MTIDYGGGLIFPDSWASGPPDPPERPECPNLDGFTRHEIGEEPECLECTLYELGMDEAA